MEAIGAIGFFAALAILGISLAAFGAASAQGRAAGTALESIARQPEAYGNIFITMLISLAFIETQTLFTFLTILILAGRVSG